ncbi:MAG: FAD-dependent oxidoreductase [Eubacteriales bacterium]|nr:FAD-dependent oxidoreductase [Eubacteriales bacterium]
MAGYEHLLSPITIRGKKFKNRMLAAPTGFFSFVKSMDAPYYYMLEERAKGGFAEVCSGEITVNDTDAARGFENVDIPARNGVFFPRAQKAADIIKAEDSIAMMELSHLGSIGEPHAKNKHPWGPITFTKENGVQVIGYTREMMEKTIRDFCDCALYAKDAGFDGVLIHGGHGWLFSQFLSPLENTREDEYGGASLENRMRFPLEVLRAVRDAVGEDFLIELRISGSDRWPGGTDAEDVAEFSTHLSGLVDILHISSGHYYRSYRTLEFSSLYTRHNCNVDSAEIIRKKCPRDVKMGVIGGINSPEDAEKLIADDIVDFVIVGRQAFADPDFMNKVAAGRADDINRCVRCMRCYSGSHEHPMELAYLEKYHITKEMELERDAKRAGAHEWQAYCTINPATRGMGFMKRPDCFTPAERRKKVLVIGGGIAGLSAARYACDRGHEVTLVEKSDRLGGILYFLDHDQAKYDLRNFRDLMIRRVMERPIDVRLQTAADEEYIKNFGADVVMIAIGSTPNMPPIPGIQRAIPAQDVYGKGSELGKRVAVIGGGMVGAETAIELAEEGCAVTIVEMAERLIMEARNMAFTSTMDKIDELGIQYHVSTKCLAVTENGVQVQDEDGSEFLLEADGVVCALGLRSRADEVERLKNAVSDGTEVFVLGDCHVIDRIGDANLDGYIAGNSI